MTATLYCSKDNATFDKQGNLVEGSLFWVDDGMANQIFVSGESDPFDDVMFHIFKEINEDPR